MRREDLEQQLAVHVPHAALGYCLDLFDDQPFAFKITPKRSTKLGDYRFDPRTKSHTVTVNHDLNKYQFLVTYLHEVAHRRVHENNRQQSPHGIIWKKEFQRLILPMLRPEVFPEVILRPLANHMKNPKASASVDIKLLSAFQQFDLNRSKTQLKDLLTDAEFNLRNRSFRKLATKRTRALCLDLQNQKKYLIPLMAEIEPKP